MKLSKKKLEAAREALKTPNNVRFSELLEICKEFFGESRTEGSHHIFKVPWPGKPWVNIQAEGKNAKSYQVKQVLSALLKLEELYGSE